MALSRSNLFGPPRLTREPFKVAGMAAVFGKILQTATAAFIGFSLPLCLTVPDVGIFFLAQAVVAVAVIVSQFGLLLTIPSVVGRSLAEGDVGRARLAATYALMICLITGLTVGFILAAITYFMPSSVNAMISELRSIAPLLIPMILAMALLGLMAELQRATFSIVAASFLPLIQNFGISVCIAVFLAFSIRPSVEHLLTISLTVLAVPIAWSVLETRRMLSRWKDAAKAPLRISELLLATWPNLVAALSFMAASQLDIWVVGLNGQSTDVAHYGIALRIATLMSIPLTVVSLTILPHIVANWTLKRRRYLQWLLSLTATGSTFIVAIGVALFGGFGQDAIRLMLGEKYLAAFTPALILSFGQLLFTAGGVAGYTLIVLGKQRLAMFSMVFIGAATVLVAIPVMRHSGIVGVATVYMASAAVQALTNAMLVRKYFGLRSYAVVINPFRVLSILSHSPRGGLPVFNYGKTIE